MSSEPLDEHGSYDAPWVLPQAPDHHYAPGCCGRPQPEHPWSEEEGRAIAEWLATEPGLTDQLRRRRNTLAQLERLHAPQIILDSQRALIREIEEKLGPGA